MSEKRWKDQCPECGETKLYSESGCNYTVLIDYQNYNVSWKQVCYSLMTKENAKRMYDLFKKVFPKADVGIFERIE